LKNKDEYFLNIAEKEVPGILDLILEKLKNLQK
jgi:hypothetical protein